MYYTSGSETEGTPQRALFRGLGRATNPTVLALGVTSLITDISSEMVVSVLPLYLVLHLQYSPMAFGAVDGLYQGGASLARLAGGVLSDRLKRHRDVAASGYLASALSRILLLVAGRHMAAIMGATVLDRVGKGLRTAPRDALISLSVPREGLASAFGVHRAMDTTGAMLGPLVAFAILALMPRAYDVVFVVSFVLGLVGVAVLLAFVRPATSLQPDARPPWSAFRSLLQERSHRRLVYAGAVLGLVTVGDGLLYLVLQRRLLFPEQYLPLLFVATPAVFMLLAFPAGRVADRVGRPHAVLAGYGCLLAAYAVVLIGPRSFWTLAVCVVLLGAYYAATDGVLMALASAVLPEGVRATGLGLVTTANGACRLVASVGFGWIWSRGSVEHAIAVYAAGLLIALVVVAPALRAKGVTRA